VTRTPGWASGVYDGRIRVPLEGAAGRMDELERVLDHEFVHALVARLGGPSVPSWLNEGLAVQFEPGGLDDATRALTRATEIPPLRELHGTFAQLNAAQAAVAYAESAVAVRRMVDLRGPAAIVILLKDLAAGVPFATAFHQRIAVPYDEFDAFVTRR
jgi:hypothetical protein